ncbi:MAG: hypothetical protein U1E27_03895 [Kiritimatiellia bacterium]|nr:hypothetical protein [Kiritimatiellia bacterium]
MMLLSITLTLVVTVVLLTVLIQAGKTKPVQGWILVVSGWAGTGLAIFGNKLLRPEMDVEGAILAVLPVLALVTALPMLRKKYGKKSESK